MYDRTRSWSIARAPGWRARPAARAVGTIRRVEGGQRVQSCPCGGACPRCQSASELVVGPPDDAFEREADAVADRVMRAAKDEATPGAQAGTPAPDAVSGSVGAPGRPLPATARAFFESRFDEDFSGVRLHTGDDAARSAREIDARAYTTGQDIVFGDGEFSPGTAAGQWLIAHELTHTIQQTGGRPLSAGDGIQRDSDSAMPVTPDEALVIRRSGGEQPAAAAPEPQETPDGQPLPRRDVAIVGQGWTGAEELAAVLAGGVAVHNVTSLEEAQKALDAINFPIGTLYFITHSTRQGELEFGSSESFVDASRIGAKFKGLIAQENAPLKVDFRGCSVGTDPKAMEKIRKALGAESVVGGTCFAVISHSTPITIVGIPVTKESDLKGHNPVPSFDKMFERTLDKFQDAEQCVLNPSRDAFFAAGGRFVALWFNPEFEEVWIPGTSVCYSETTMQVVDPKAPERAVEGCRLVVVEKKGETAEEAPSESNGD